MVFVTGSILTAPEHTEAVLAAGVEHTLRSRSEPGCIAHDVLRDAENPQRVVFVEQWEDRAALRAHFDVPGSREFVSAIRPLALEPPEIKIFDAAPSGS